MRESDRLLDLAGAASDGAEVDWGREEEGCPGEGERSLVRALGFLALVLGEHRRLHGAGGLPAPARTWGPLEILEVIGQGAFGTVYRARDPRLDRPVALKLRPAHPGSAESLVAEGRLMARVRHPNVAAVHGADLHDGRVGLWMELVEGPTLAQVIRERGPMGAREAVAAGLELCAALAAVHAAGLVHGDVKPQNVVRGAGGRLVLMDFGSGRDLLREARRSEGEVSGTPLFMAPEVLAGGTKTVRSDLYSLGAVLFHLLTGRYPVEAGSVEGLRSAHAEGRTRPIRDLRPDIPAPLAACVGRALARDPEARFGSAGDLERALLDSLRGTAGARRRLSRPAAVAAALAATAALVAVDVWLRRGGPVAPAAGGPPSAEAGLAGPSPGPSRPAAPATGAPPSREAAVAALVAGARVALFRAGVAADEPLESGARVSPGDRLFLEFRADAPAHVYVLNLDRRGGGYVLFPVPGAQWSNPLAAGVTHRLPGGRDWENDSWEVTSAGGREAIIVVASLRPLDRLEAALASLEAASPEGPARPLEGEILRGVARLADSARPAGGDPAAVLGALRDLATAPPEAGGVLVREIELENP